MGPVSWKYIVLFLLKVWTLTIGNTVANVYDGSNMILNTSTIFRAVWNLPNVCGDRYGTELPLSKYGIEFNSNHGYRVGDVINVFNAGNFGSYPYVDPAGQSFNGGLPQLANITTHLEKATSDILASIQDPDYDGLVMINWEAWHPTWDSIEKRYQGYSIEHVRRLHPEWNDEVIIEVAKLEWNQGARLFMESTLKLGKQLRPKALWGFYHYPYCTVLTANASCKPAQYRIDDEIMWFFNETTVLYPDIYLPPDRPFPEAIVIGELAETFRLKEKSSDPKGVVLSYARFNYSHTDYYYTLQDLNDTILTSAEFGTHGTVFWGDTFDELSAQTCQELRDYIDKALGPTLLMAREGATACSERVCSGKGRCVGKVLTCGRGTYSPNFLKSREDFQELYKSNVCSCRCMRGWGGVDCSLPVKY